MKTKILILILFVLMIVNTVKADELGPYDEGHKYYIEMYNIDDNAKAIVNGNTVSSVSYRQESGKVDITGFLSYRNTIEFVLDNTQQGYTYGFRILQDNSIIWSDSCGKTGNFLTRQFCGSDTRTGEVYHKYINLNIKRPVIDNIQNIKRIPGFEYSNLIIAIIVISIYIKRKQQ